MYFIRNLTFISLFIILTTNAGANVIGTNLYTGLTFRSHEVEKDERTSLNLIPDKPLDLSGGFSLTFDLKLQRTSFGHIFRVVLNDSTSLDMFAFTQKGKISFVLNKAPHAGIVTEIDITKSPIIEHWAKVTLRVGKEFIRCSINEQTKVINSSIGDFKIDKLFFGANKYKSFFTSDVPRMTVRNIVIKNKDEQIVRNWDLAKHGNGVVYDRVDMHPALVENGVWEIDKHIQWKKEQTLVLGESFPQIAIDTISNRVFVATSDSLYTFHNQEHTIEKIKVKGGQPFLESSSYLIFNPKSNQLISYNTHQSAFITYDFKSNSWSGNPINRDLSIQHHNRYLDLQGNKLVLFGGYGAFKYNSVLSTHDLNGGNWTFYDFSKKISPRYLASLGNCGDGSFLIFGGFGSESGLQEEGPHNYYDLFKIDTNRKTCVRLGAIKEPPLHYNFGNSMVLGKDEFYTLAYRNDLQKSNIRLLEVNTKTLDYQIYGDSIPYCFLDRDSYCDLYLSKSRTLYAVVLERDVRTYPFKISVYSLAFPPLNRSDVLQQVGGKTNWIVFTILVICIFIGLTVLWFIRFKKMKPNKDYSTLPKTPALKDKKTSCIHLLGGFRVLDQEGHDVSASFTHITKQLLLAFILETYTFGNRLTSKRLEEMIWFEMDKASATNNRNVNIRKLRILLQQIGPITLTKDTLFWEIHFAEDCFCDFKDVMTLLNEVKSMSTIDKQIITQIVHLSKSGTLLPDTEFEWIEKYKTHYSYLLIDVLNRAAKQTNISDDYKLLVELSDVILIHDPIDEDAIQIKCRSLYRLGQKGLSKQCFNKFCLEYQTILNEEPKLKYDSLI